MKFTGIWDRIVTFFRWLFGRQVEELDLTKKKPPRKWWEFPFRVINTSHGGRNMPKYQPCSHCGLNSKRDNKTENGGYYWCRRCQVHFFVRASGKPAVKKEKGEKIPLFNTAGSILSSRSLNPEAVEKANEWRAKRIRELSAQPILTLSFKDRHELQRLRGS